MVRQIEGADPLLRSVPCRGCGPVPASAGRDSGSIAHQQHHGGGRTMMRAYCLFTGPDGNSHVVRGSVNGGKLVEASDQ